MLPYVMTVSYDGLQAILVQMSCMGYEFVLLKLCNLQHMRRMSVFLALPSATIRGMTNRPCLVGVLLPTQLEHFREQGQWGMPFMASRCSGHTLQCCTHTWAHTHTYMKELLHAVQLLGLMCLEHMQGNEYLLQGALQCLTLALWL